MFWSSIILPWHLTFLPILSWAISGLAILVTLPLSETKTTSPLLSVQFSSQAAAPALLVTHLELQTQPVISFPWSFPWLGSCPYCPNSSIDEPKTSTRIPTIL